VERDDMGLSINLPLSINIKFDIILAISTHLT